MPLEQVKPSLGVPRPFGASVPRAGPRSPAGARSPASYAAPSQNWSQPAAPPLSSHNQGYASNTLPRQHVPGTKSAEYCANKIEKEKLIWMKHESLLYSLIFTNFGCMHIIIVSFIHQKCCMFDVAQHTQASIVSKTTIHSRWHYAFTHGVVLFVFSVFLTHDTLTCTPWLIWWNNN